MMKDLKASFFKETWQADKYNRTISLSDFSLFIHDRFSARLIHRKNDH